MLETIQSFDPDTPVLVAVLNNRGDWERIQAEGWYRIPLNRAPRRMAAAVIAWYQTRAFAPEDCQVRWYAPIHRCSIATRRELLPGDPDHPRAGERYWRLDHGPPIALPHPIRAARFRRLTFIATCWERLLTAQDVTELWMGDAAIAMLCQTLEAEGFSLGRRQLRDEADGAPRAMELAVRPTLEGACVAWDGGEVSFDGAALLWDMAECVAKIKALIRAR